MNIQKYTDMIISKVRISKKIAQDWFRGQWQTRRSTRPQGSNKWQDVFRATG
jgi:hypothetical protein